MKKKINLIIILSLIITFSALKAQVNFQEGTFQQMVEKAKSENKILMVDFFTDWCKWCVELDIKVYSDPQVAAFANKNFISYKIDAEKGEGPVLKDKYTVPGYPTILFLKDDGVEVDRIVGYFHADKFLRIIKDYNAGINTFDFLKAKLKENPNDITSNYKIGEKLVDLESKDEAKPYFQKITEVDPDNTSGYLDDATLYIAYINGDNESIKKFEDQFPKSDRIKDSYLFLAEVYSTKYKDYDNAEKTYAKAFEKYGKDDKDVGEAYGQYLLDRIYATAMIKDATSENLKTGLELCEKCLIYVKGSIHEASVYYCEATIYNNLGDKDKANEAIDKAIKIHNKKAFRDLKEKINAKI
jgi:tetratricopeptide (TPR) repeat protein